MLNVFCLLNDVTVIVFTLDGEAKDGISPEKENTTNYVAIFVPLVLVILMAMIVLIFFIRRARRRTRSSELPEIFTVMHNIQIYITLILYTIIIYRCKIYIIIVQNTFNKFQLALVLKLINFHLKIVNIHLEGMIVAKDKHLSNL